MTKFKKPLLFALCLLPIAIVAGIFVGSYQLDTYSDEIIAQAVAQFGSTKIMIVVGAVQTALYALFCGFFGYILADRIGLWRSVRFQKRKIIVTLILSIVGGLLFSLDHWTFGNVIDGIQTANRDGMSIAGVLASVLYGGIIEELMMRLFFMSLITFIIWKLFFRKCDKEHIPTVVFVTANIIAAVAFAAGHLPATVSMFGGLTPMIIFRCFLLNGGFALLFGWLYRKYGIIYAMTSHALFHIVSKSVWFIFI